MFLSNPFFSLKYIDRIDLHHQALEFVAGGSGALVKIDGIVNFAKYQDFSAQNLVATARRYKHTSKSTQLGLKTHKSMFCNDHLNLQNPANLQKKRERNTFPYLQCFTWRSGPRSLYKSFQPCQTSQKVPLRQKSQNINGTGMYFIFLLCGQCPDIFGQRGKARFL